MASISDQISEKRFFCNKNVINAICTAALKDDCVNNTLKANQSSIEQELRKIVDDSRENIKKTFNIHPDISITQIAKHANGYARRREINQFFFDIIGKYFGIIPKRFVISNSSVTTMLQKVIENDKKEIQKIIDDREKKYQNSQNVINVDVNKEFRDNSARYVLKECMNMRELLVQINVNSSSEVEEFKEDY